MSQKFLIWSIDKEAWWKPKKRGYCSDPKQAGVFSYEEAIEICKSNYSLINNHSHKPSEAIVPILN